MDHFQIPDRSSVKSVSLGKQFLVNNLELPYDIQQIINGFCFYDAKTWDIMERKKQFMEEVNLYFNHYLSRCTPKCEHCEDWVVGDENEDDDYRMLAANCRRCGNYIHCESTLARALKCACSN